MKLTGSHIFGVPARVLVWAGSLLLTVLILLAVLEDGIALRIITAFAIALHGLWLMAILGFTGSNTPGR